MWKDRKILRRMDDGSTKLSFLTVGVILLLCFLGPSAAAIIGIDFGSELIKVASVRPGAPFQIVTDEGAHRKIPALIGFDAKERVFGTNAQSLAIRRPHLVLQNVKSALGHGPEPVSFPPDVHTWTPAGDGSGRLQVHIPWTPPTPHPRTAGEGAADDDGGDADGGISLTPEQATAMLLEYIKNLAIADAEGIPVKDCVITVPSYWTQTQRQALLDAAEMAGLNVLTLVNENTAFAVHYGLDREYTTETPDHVVAFYNMGTQNTEVSIVRYSSYLPSRSSGNRAVGQLSVEGLGFEEGLGGFAFDELLVEYMADAFTAAAGDGGGDESFRESPRAMAKLRTQANRVKKILSANPETPIGILGLHQDRDLKTHITRTEFNALARPLLDRVTAPLTEALTDAGLQLQDLDALVFVGGCSRIPAVHDRIQSFITQPPAAVRIASNIDRDEAAALGAVFIAANHSTAFQVRKFGVVDRVPHSLSVRLTDLPPPSSSSEASEASESPAAESVNGDTGEEEGRNEPLDKQAKSIFDTRSRLGRRKTVSFQHDRDFQAEITHSLLTDHLNGGHGSRGADGETAAADDGEEEEEEELTPPPAPSAGRALPEDAAALLAVQQVTGLSEAVLQDPFLRIIQRNGTKPKVSVTFGLDSNGILRLLESKATMEEIVPVEIVKKKPETESGDLQKKEAAAEGEEAEALTGEDATAGEGEASPQTEEITDDESFSGQEEEEEREAEAPEEGSDDEAVESEAETEAPKEAEEDPGVEYKWVKKIRRVQLRVSPPFTPEPSHSPLTREQKAMGKSVLDWLNGIDAAQRARAEARNTLESLVYSSRAQLWEEDWESVSTEDEREDLRGFLEEVEDWLYEQDDDTPVTVFRDKLTELQGTISGIEGRAKEFTARPEAVEAARELAQHVRATLEEWKETKPWLPEEDLTTLQEMVKRLEDWLEEKETEQSQLQLTEEPAFSSTDVYTKMRPIARKLETLSRIRKPKPKPVKPEKSSSSNDSNSDSSSSSSDGDHGEETGMDDAAATDGEEGQPRTEEDLGGDQEAEAPEQGNGDETVVNPDEKEAEEGAEDGGDDSGEEDGGHTHPEL